VKNLEFESDPDKLEFEEHVILLTTCCLMDKDSLSKSNPYLCTLLLLLMYFNVTGNNDG